MPKMSEMSLTASGLKEYWSEHCSIQMYVDLNSKQEYVLWTTICEVCHTQTHQTLRKAETNSLYGEIVDSQTYSCFCNK